MKHKAVTIILMPVLVLLTGAGCNNQEAGIETIKATIDASVQATIDASSQTPAQAAQNPSSKIASPTPTSTPVAPPAPTATPLSLATPTPIHTPTPTPEQFEYLGISIAVSEPGFVEVAKNDSTRLNVEDYLGKWKCWTIRFSNSSDKPRKFVYKTELTGFDANRVSYNQIQSNQISNRFDLSANEQASDILCGRFRSPEISDIELKVSIPSLLIDSKGLAKPRHMGGFNEKTSNWAKFSINGSHPISIKSQPENLPNQSLYSNIPTKGSQWVIQNNGNRNVFVELCAERHWKTNGEFRDYVCWPAYRYPIKTGDVLEVDMIEQMYQFIYERVNPIPSMQMVLSFTGIWYKLEK